MKAKKPCKCKGKIRWKRCSDRELHQHRVKAFQQGHDAGRAQAFDEIQRALGLRHYVERVVEQEFHSRGMK